MPQTTAAEEAGEVPSDWEVDASDVIASVKAGRLPHLTWARAILGGVVALSLLFSVAGAYVLVRGPIDFVGPADVGAAAAADGIAVLPFAMTGEGLELYGEGMVDLMSADLDGLSGYRAIDSRTVLARWSRRWGKADGPSWRLHWRSQAGREPGMPSSAVERISADGCASQPTSMTWRTNRE